MKSAVLVIDVQNGVFVGHQKPFESDLIIERICKITAHAKSQGGMVVYIQHEAPGVVERGTENWQLIPALEVKNDDITVRKNTPDAFFNTELDAVLRKEEITHLFICGYSSDFCIDRTTFRAVNFGYQVTLVGDAHTTHDKPHLDAQKIREHHNFILSRHPSVTLVGHEEVIRG